jgi:kynurenine formamidase
MPEIEKQEFSFPDEEKKKPEVEDDGGVDVEIETSAQSKKTTSSNDDDELEKYDEKVKKRIADLQSGFHSERRRAEEAAREREEAVAFAQSVAEENKKLKGSLSDGQSALLEQAKKVVANEVDDAKRRYKLAYESGDSDALVEAQELLTSAKIKMERVNNFKPALQKEENEVKIAPREVPRQPQADPKAARWQSENSWFGSDDEMTSFALGLHTKLIKSGIDPSSDEYYTRLNSRIRQVFPENFGLDNNESETQTSSAPRQKSNVVAPATRSTSSSKIRLTPFQVTMAKKFGVSHELMAQKIAELRKGN